MTRTILVAATALMLASCADAAAPDATPDACMGIVTRVTSQPTRGGAVWYVGVRDTKGTTHVCRATEKAQALQPDDRVDGRDMWK